jgi:hypothetical protein
MKTTSRHSIVKLWKTKEKILKAAIEKSRISFKGNNESQWTMEPGV